MLPTIPAARLHRIRDPGNFHRTMREDVELLSSHGAHMSLTTVIMCCIDALAAGPGDASRAKFERFVERELPELCLQLGSATKAIGKKGSSILYDKYRNGFTHMRGPKNRFAIAENYELAGNWAGVVRVEGAGEFVAINLERLTGEFLQLLARLELKHKT